MSETKEWGGFVMAACLAGMSFDSHRRGVGYHGHGHGNKAIRAQRKVQRQAKKRNRR